METAGGVMTQLFERNMPIPTLMGQAVDTEFPLGLETAGGVMMQLFERNMHIPTKGQAVGTEFFHGLGDCRRGDDAVV